MNPPGGTDEPSLRSAPGLRVRPLGDRTVIAEIGLTTPDGTFSLAPVDLTTSRMAVALAESASQSLGSAALDVVPSYRSLLVEYDPAWVSYEEVERQLHRDFETPGSGGEEVGRTVTIPVVYGGEFGPDLEDVAAHTGLTPDEVIASHSGGRDYQVSFLGFSPGYGYLLGLPDQLAIPRLATPRARVPAGSVAIGGEQTAIYPQATPGGWRLIGRTAVPLFDVDQTPAALLRPGDRIAFRSVDRAEHDDVIAKVRNGTYRPEIDWPRGAPLPDVGTTGPAAGSGPRAWLDIMSPGLLTTVQDVGRSGLGAQGISPGGALDRSAFMAANRLAGNPAGTAVLEMCVSGPTLRPSHSIRVALTGADLGAEVDSVPVALWEPFVVPAGSTLSFSTARATATGLRGYLAIAGGIDVPVMIGSRSTDLTAGFGGLDGRALIRGDRLPIGQTLHDHRLADVVVGPRPRALQSSVTLRVVVGPHDDLLAAGDLARLLGEPYAVTSQSSHMGVRLSGAALQVADAGNLVSEGIATGAVQIPADGQPIILLAGRGTVGGYAKVACVIDADLDLTAQLRPGTMVSFRAVSLAEAKQAGRRYRQLLGCLASDLGAELVGDSNPTRTMNDVSAGLLALARAAITGQTGRGSKQIRDELSTAPLVPANHTWGSGGPRPQLLADTDLDHRGIIRASLLGHFHRGARSGGPPFVDVGDQLAAGVTIGTIVVLGAPSDVVTEHPVEIVAFLVDDGEPVEYGQPLVRTRSVSGPLVEGAG